MTGLAGLTSKAIAQTIPQPMTPLAEQAQATGALRNEGRYLPIRDLARAGKAIASEQFAAFWGDELSALAAASRPASAVDLRGAQAEDALEAIAQAAVNRRVVMLNEAHVASRHRAFLALLLRRLHRDGFTHLAAETFSNGPSRPARIEALRGEDPVGFSAGWYTADPVFAEAVREALQLGYLLSAYEQRPDQRLADKPADVPTREQAQADNFAELLERFPGGRFLVYVGYAHVGERPDAGGTPWFAARLKAKTGIDPLTIAQADTGSFGPHGQDSDLTSSVLARFRPQHPIVVRSADGSPLGTGFSADFAVFHPRLADVDGRPGWLAADPARRRVHTGLPEAIAEECIAQAVRAADPHPAIPADQYLPPPGSKGLTFLLRPGRYRIRLERRSGFKDLGEILA